MSVRDRAALVGVSLRSIFHHAAVSHGDRTLRAAIRKLNDAMAVQIEQDRAGRDRALDALAEER